MAELYKKGENNLDKLVFKNICVGWSWQPEYRDKRFCIRIPNYTFIITRGQSNYDEQCPHFFYLTQLNERLPLISISLTQ